MNSPAKFWIAIGALIGGVGVALGAFGAHGLPDFLARLGYGDDLPRRINLFETAIRYQMFHALAIVVTGLALQVRPATAWRIGGWLFFAGVLLFSGLLKVMTVASPSWNWLGAIVPFGGASFIAGWIALAVGALGSDPTETRKS